MQLDELPPLDGVPARARDALRSFDTDAGTRRLRYLIGVLVFLALVVLIGRGGSRPRDPYLVDQDGAAASAAPASGSVSGSGTTTVAPTGPSSAGPSSPSPGRAGIDGFAQSALTVVAPSGTRTLCVAVADSEAQHQQGLMGRHDLGGLDAMAFRFTTDVSARFYMRNTPLPLSIAWFDGRGAFVSAADMDPCPDRDGCPTYGATGPYQLAVEVPRGGLAAVGLTSGSTVTFGGACG